MSTRRSTEPAATGKETTGGMLKKSETAGTQAIDRALALLFCFTHEQPERRIMDISSELGLHKSTVYRLLQALAAKGLVRQNAVTGAYRLGASVLDLAARFVGSLDLRNAARPHIEQLAREEGESVNLSILDGSDAVLIDRIVGTTTPQLVSRFAPRIPIYCSAAGKSLLLDLDEDGVRALLAGETFRKLTPHTITDMKTFLQRFRVWKRQGWAYNDEESEVGLRTVGVPIHGHDGRIVASISVSAPTFRMGDARAKTLARATLRAARAASEAMGAPG